MEELLEARICQRIDTAENWAAENPVLLEGEMGIIADSATYKVGDGVTPWLDLPERGLPATLKHELGDDPNAAISQWAMTEILSSLDDDIRKDTLPVNSPAGRITEEDINKWNNNSGGGKGTITEIIMNGESKGTSGTVDLGTVLTEHQDISGLATKAELENVAGSLDNLVTKEKLTEVEGELAKKQDAITDLTKIREGAAAGKTALQAIPEGYVTESELAAAMVNKVDKVLGKQLSTEDFTTALKEKLEGMTGFDASDIEKAIEGLQGQLDALTGGDTSNAIESFNEIIAFLEGLEDTQDLASIIASIEGQIAAVNNAIPTKTSQLNNDSGFLTAHQDISGLATKDELTQKQDIIADLTTIRRNAALGATALQSVPAAYVTDSELSAMAFATQNMLSTGLASKADLNIISQSESVIAAAQPDTCYIITPAAAGDVRVTAFAAPTKAMAQYSVMFAGASSLSLPSGVLWANGEAPEIDSTMHYELSVVGVKMASGTIYKAVIAGFKTAE